MRRVYVDVKVHLIIEAEEGVEIGNIIDEMEYDFISFTDGARICDSDIIDFEITDSMYGG